MATKKEINEGLYKFLENDLIPNIEDKQVKFILSMVKNGIKNNSDMIDSFLNNSMVASMITESNGEYNINKFANCMKTILEDSYYPIEIPKVPLLSPEEKCIKITANDIDSLMNYINQKPIV